MLDASTLTPAARLAKRVLNLVELFGGDDGAIGHLASFCSED
jgi:hypothetical protein